MKSTDSMLRVLIDPRIPVEHYVQIQKALVQSGKFEVVDRRDGFSAAIDEQDLQYRSQYHDRFSDQEKWAMIGRMYGAHGIITANAQCFQKKAWSGEFRRVCKQFLNLINGQTGVVELSVSGENSDPWGGVGYTVPDWDETVQAAIDAYPEYFKAREIQHPLDQTLMQSEESARREREKMKPRMPAAQKLAPGEYSVEEG